MEYQPPSFQLSDESQIEAGETVIRPLSPVNRGIRPSPRDTKSRRGATSAPSNPHASHSAIAKGKESLLDAGLSASEMLRRLRKEKEELLRMQSQRADGAAPTNAVPDSADTNISRTDATSAISANLTIAAKPSGKGINVTEEIGASSKTFGISAPPPPPNPPPRHKQTVMASPRSKRNPGGFFRDAEKQEPSDALKVDQIQLDENQMIDHRQSDIVALERDEKQAELIRQLKPSSSNDGSWGSSSGNSSGSRSKTLIQRGKAMFGKRQQVQAQARPHGGSKVGNGSSINNSGDGNGNNNSSSGNQNSRSKKKPNRLELARLRSLSLLKSNSSGGESISCKSVESDPVKDDGAVPELKMDSTEEDVQPTSPSDNALSSAAAQVISPSSSFVNQYTLPKKKEVSRFNVKRLREKRGKGGDVAAAKKKGASDGIMTVGQSTDMDETKDKSGTNSNSKEANEKTKESNFNDFVEQIPNNSTGKTNNIEKAQSPKPAVQSSVPGNKISFNPPPEKKKAPKINKALSRASSAMISTTTRSRRRPLGGAISTEDDVSVVSSTVSVASSSTAVHCNKTIQCPPEKNIGESPKTSDRARSSGTSTTTPKVVAAEELDDAAIFSDLLTLSPRRDESVERTEEVVVRSLGRDTPKTIRNASYHRGRRNHAFKFGNEKVPPNEEVGSITKKESNADTAPVVKSPPRMKRNSSVEGVMSVINSNEDKLEVVDADLKTETKKLDVTMAEPRIAGNSVYSKNGLMGVYTDVDNSTSIIASIESKSDTARPPQSPRRFGRRNRSLSRQRLTKIGTASEIEEKSTYDITEDDNKLSGEAETISALSCQSMADATSGGNLSVAPSTSVESKRDISRPSPSPRRFGRRNRSFSRPGLTKVKTPSDTEHQPINDNKDGNGKFAREAEATSSILNSSSNVSDTPSSRESLSAFKAARRGGRSLSRAFSRSRVPSKGIANGAINDAKSSSEPSSAGTKVEKNGCREDNEVLSKQNESQSFASSRAVTRKGRSVSRPKKSSASSPATPPRSIFKRGKDHPISSTPPPSSPLFVNRRSRSLSKPRDSNESSTAPAKFKPTLTVAASGSSSTSRHAAAAKIRKDYRRRSNSLPRSQRQEESELKSTTSIKNGSLKDLLFEPSPTVAGTKKLNQFKNDKSESQAEVLYGKHAASPKYPTDAAPVPSQKAIISILNQKSKKKAAFYVPIAQLCETVLPIQTLARVFLAKLALEKRKESIVRLQAIFRRWSCEHYLHSCIFLAVNIQACQRGYIAREQAYFFHLGILSVTRLQACFRGKASRRNLRYQHFCATRIQALIRGHWECINYVLTWSNIVLAQSVVRRRLERKKYLVEKAALKMTMKNAAATKIQACWRAFICYTDFSDDLADIVTVQCVIRRWLAGERSTRIRTDIANMSAASTIAAAWRGFGVRREYIVLLDQVITVQSVIRRWFANQLVTKIRSEQEALAETSAATKIAASWRGLVRRREYIITVGDLILCQAIVRRKLATNQKSKLVQAKEVTCAIRIQAIWRGFVANNKFIHAIADIILVQSIVRRYRAIRIVVQWREQRSILVAAVTRLSATWRRFYVEREYKYNLADIILVQSLARMHSSSLVLKRLKDEHNVKRSLSSTIISKTWRRYCESRSYDLIVVDIILCQSVIRRKIAINKFKKLRWKLHSLCATLIQAKWRSSTARERFIFNMVYIITVQSLARRWIAYGHVEKLKKDNREHQMLTTARLLAEHESAAASRIASGWKQLIYRKRYLELKSKIVTIQTKWRGFIAFEKYVQIIYHLLAIQACARRLIASRRVQKLREEIILRHGVCNLQSHVRRRIAMKVFREKRNWLKRLQGSACTCIQAIYRGHTTRMTIATENASAIKIQAVFRAFVGRLNYMFALSSIMICQSVCRARLERQELRRKQRAVCKIQCSYRGHTTRMTIATENASAIKIQAVFRAFVARLNYMFALSSIIICQSLCRARLERQELRRKQMAATRIQSSYRVFSYRMDYILTVSSVIICQSIVRRKLALKQSELLKLCMCKKRQTSAILIQSFYRSYFARMNYIVSLMRIIISQSAYRRWHETRKVNQLRVIKHESAVKVIQTRFRGYIAFTKYIDAVVNIIICQAVVRKNIAMRKTHIMKEEIAVTKISACYRRYAAHSSYSATITNIILCQSYVRRLMASKDVVTMRCSYHGAATVIQSAFRGYIHSVQFILTLSRIIMLEAQVRGYLARSALKHHRSVRDHAATSIQKCWRSFKVETDFIMVLAGIISLQANIRCFLHRRKYCNIRNIRISAATKIQSLFRSNVYFDDYVHSLVNITLCQSYVRRWHAKQKVLRMQHHQVHEAMALIIQSRWRGYIARCDYIIMLLDIVSTQSIARRWIAVRKMTDLRKRRDSAIMIQAAARGYIAYTNFVFTLIDIIFCQAVVRSKLARIQKEKLLCNHTSYHKMATLIQNNWRAYAATKLIRSATLIQAFTRRHIARKHFAKIKAYDACQNRALCKMRERAAVIVLQRSWEYFQLRKLQKSATAIQRTWRSHMNLLHAAQATLNSVIFIQAVIRRMLTQKRTACALRHVAISESDNIMLFEHEAIITLQRWWRRHVYFTQTRENSNVGLSYHAPATVIQSAFRGYVAFSHYVIVCYFILKIQALVRGYLSRSSFHRKKVLARSEEDLAFDYHRHRAATRATMTYLHEALPSHRTLQSSRQSLAQDFNKATEQRAFNLGKKSFLIQDSLAQEVAKTSRQSLLPAHHMLEPYAQAAFKSTRQSLPTAHVIHQLPSQQNFNKPNRTLDHVPPTPAIARKLKQIREKRAAFVIERFFINIKAEIDREIKQLERKQKKKKGKRNLICNTDANVLSKGFVQSTVDSHEYDNARSSAPSHHHGPSFGSSSHHGNHLRTPQAYYYTPGVNEGTTIYPHLPRQHVMGTPSPLGRSGYTDYQSRCMGASGYAGQHSLSNNQGYQNYKVSLGKPAKSEDSSHQSLELTQTRSETEVRLAKLQYEVAGLVSRYQVAEDELQSVGHSMGGNSSSTKDSQHCHYQAQEVNQGVGLRETNGDRDFQENSSSNHQVSSALNVTPPRAPLQQRLNHLHDVTPPRLSYSQKASLQHHRSNNLHVPVPMRYSHSNPHNLGRFSPQIIQPSQSNNMHNRFPLIPSASHSNQDSKPYLMAASTESNSFISPHNSPMHFAVSSYRDSRYLAQGQSPMNYYEEPSQPNHPSQYHSGVPRTPSGRQF